MTLPELMRGNRKSWSEISSYYQAMVDRTRSNPQPGGFDAWMALRDFSLQMERQETCRSLCSVGNMGIILIFRDEDCVVEKGYLAIGPGWPIQQGNRDIGLGYFNSWPFNPQTLRYSPDTLSAVKSFEESLSNHGFVVPNK